MTYTLLEYTLAALENNNCTYDPLLGAHLLRVYSPKGREFYFYYTTGRWSGKHNGYFSKKHYRSRGVDDFLERFVINE